MTDSLPADRAASPPDEARERQVTAAQLGARLLKLLAPTRIKCLSLHDAGGELRWISQGPFRAVSQRYLQDALDAFGLDAGSTHLERELEEGGRALFFCARTPLGERQGLAFAIVSSRRRPDIRPDVLRERVLATMRRFSLASPGTPPSPVAVPTAEGASMPAAESMPAVTAVAAAAAVAATAIPADHSESAESVDAGSLRSRIYARLRPGGMTRRYEIAADSSISAPQDLSRATRLIALLQRRGARVAPTPVSFALPLCAASVLEADFFDQLAPHLEQAGIEAELMGFCIPAAAWDVDPAATLRFMDRSAQHGCFVALDDFNLARGGFALLSRPALRCLKLDAAMIAGVVAEKLAHAQVAAIVKAARVLGLYCVAKGVGNAATARWLASAGVEFADRATRAAAAATRGAAGAATTRRARVLKLAAGH